MKALSIALGCIALTSASSCFAAGGAPTSLPLTPQMSAAQAAQQAAKPDAAAGAPRTYQLIQSQQSSGGNATTSLAAATLTNIDNPKTLVCPGPTKCLIEGDLWAQFYQGSTTGNVWTLVMLVDGSPAVLPVYGPFGGAIPADGTPIAGYIPSSMAQIAPGSHVVQMQAYSANGATLSYFNAVYHIYLSIKQ